MPVSYRTFYRLSIETLIFLMKTAPWSVRYFLISLIVIGEVE